jgi:branched-subunit amino acid aminotransferase/4-amino-4-deoxychorismate lyase
MLPREDAKISAYDSGFMLGDGVWEGMRLHNGRFLFEDLHLNRLFAGAKVPVINIDGRIIGDGRPGEMFRRVRKLYAEMVIRECPPSR